MSRSTVVRRMAVDGKQIGATFTARASHAAGQAEALTFRGDWAAGAHTVSVTFLNDAYGGTTAADRNLYVDGATYNGAAVSGAAQALFSAGTKAFGVSDATPLPASAPITGTTSADTLAGTASSDVLVGGGGKDTITGGTGADTFVYRAMSDTGDRILDFSASKGDRLDLSAILGTHGHTYVELRAAGFVALHGVSDGVRVLVSADGSGTSYATMATLVGVAETGLGAAFLFA